jgi:signal transduction histidine kinase
MAEKFCLHIKRPSIFSQFMVILAGFALSLLFSFLFRDFFIQAERNSQDMLFKVRYAIKGSEVVSPFLVNIRLTDKTYSREEQGNREFSSIDTTTRYLLAGLLDYLNESPAEAICLDFIFHRTGNNQVDSDLATGIRDSGRVYLPVHCFPESLHMQTPEGSHLTSHTLMYPAVIHTGKPPQCHSLAVSIPALGHAASGTGHFNLPGNQPPRHLPLFYQYESGYIPSLVFRMVCDVLQVPDSQITVKFGDYVLLEKARFSPRLVKNVRIPIDERGYVRLNFPGPWNDSFIGREIQDLLHDQSILDMLVESSLVFVSDISSQSQDYSTGVFDIIYPNTGLHLTLANMILTDNFLKETGPVYTIIVVFILAAVLFIFLRYAGSWWFYLLSSSFVLLYLLWVVFQFMYINQIPPITGPVMGIIISLILAGMYRYGREKYGKLLIINQLKKLSAILVQAENFSGDTVDQSRTACKKYNADLGLEKIYQSVLALQESKEAMHDIVHEIKNTAAGAQYMLNRLINTIQLDSRTIRQLTLIMQEMGMLYEFSTKHLDMAMVEKTGQITMTLVQMAPLVNEIIAKHQPWAAEKNISFRVDISPNLTFPGEPVYVQILINNIIENSIKYSNADSTITITSSLEDRCAVLCIYDQGPGFPGEILDTQEHKRRDLFLTARGKRAGSHGIGLDLCRKITTLHRGIFYIENRQEGGAAVTIRLPRGE